MGIIGVSVGMAFILAIILGAPLAAADGLKGLFATSVLALCALILLWVIVPTPESPRRRLRRASATCWRCWPSRRLLVLNASVFLLHACSPPASWCCRWCWLHRRHCR